VQPVLGLLAVQLGLAQVDQHQVHVGTRVATVMPCSATSASSNREAKIRAPDRVRRCRSANSAEAATLNDTALAAMTCSNGPPCCPGTPPS